MVEKTFETPFRRDIRGSPCMLRRGENDSDIRQKYKITNIKPLNPD